MIGSIELSEDVRSRLLEQRSKQEAMELYVAGGNARDDTGYIRTYEALLTDINELKREILEEAGELENYQFDYTFYFDTVAGKVWIEDAE